MPSLADLLELLLAPTREREDPFVDIDLDELIGIDSPFERFDDETWDSARVLMDSIGTEPTYLSTLLEREAHEVALLVALSAMRCWGERGTADTRDPMLAGISARDDGTELKLERFTLPDLTLSGSRFRRSLRSGADEFRRRESTSPASGIDRSRRPGSSTRRYPSLSGACKPTRDTQAPCGKPPSPSAYGYSVPTRSSDSSSTRPPIHRSRFTPTISEREFKWTSANERIIYGVALVGIRDVLLSDGQLVQ